MISVETRSGLVGFDDFEVRLGDELRGERATLGKSLLDIQRDLRIKAAYIAAIENCDPSVFPNKGFIAGYVRSYARYLGMDGDVVFARFCRESGFAGVNSDLQKGSSSSGSAKVISGPARVGKDDALLRPLMPDASLNGGFFSEFSPSAIGSVFVLIALVAGLTYGGYAVIQDIQRVEIAPVDQTPGALSEVVVFSGPGLEVERVDLAQGTDLATDEPADQDLARLYQPRELDVPDVVERDGPIVDIDPDTEGLLAVRLSEADDATVEPAIATNAFDDGDPNDPRVREVVGPPTVNVVAQQAAWVRVYQADGTVLFEKILEKGEVYTLPNDVDAPLLRAGNSGYVYLLVNEEPFGPIGNGTGVAKNISLLPDSIRDSFEFLAEPPEEVLASVSALSVAPEE